MNRILAAAALAVALPGARPAGAQIARDPSSQPASSAASSPGAGCHGRMDAEQIVRCAWAISPEVTEARHRLAAVAGRRTAAAVWLPNNPVLSATLAQRQRGDAEEISVLNWAVSLSLELEVAGQRGARIAVADAEAAASARRLGVAEQEVGAAALAAWLEAIAANQAVALADELVKSGQAFAAVAEGRAKEALLSGVEANVARAEAVRIGLLRVEAVQRLDDSRARLAPLLGLEAQQVVLPAFDGALVPAPDVSNRAALDQRALVLRGEIGAAEMERRILEQRLALHKRERIPNLTISAFAERGEINDRILGLGLSVPLPLPAPLGRTRSGEIAETVAQIRAAESSLELVRRRVRLDVARAFSAFSAGQQARSLFAQDLLVRARADLVAIREAVAARQLALREAVAWQRSLIELLQADIETKLARDLAIVDLERVVGLPLVAGERNRR
jgi:outer membrane protein, heavy metal efflux system